MNANTRKKLVLEKFDQQTGSPPSVWTRAPGRVDLMGSHTDYNEGYVLTLAIDRDTWVAVRPRNDRVVSVSSLNLDGLVQFNLDAIVKEYKFPWANYVGGVAHILQEQGYPLCGFDGVYHSTIPLGSGLSSSAALEVATAMAFQALAPWEIEPVPMAQICQRAENEFVGLNCGILDQYTSLMGVAGCALSLDCRHLTSTTVHIPPGASMIVCDTRAGRELTGSNYSVRRDQCNEGVRLLQEYIPEIRALRDVDMAHFTRFKNHLPGVVARRCEFVIQENERVLQLGRILQTGLDDEIGPLMADSYTGARDLYEIVTPDMAKMMDAMAGAPGVIGARQAGAGFGGCMIALVQESRVESFSEHVSNEYSQASGIVPNIYRVQAAAGAGILNDDLID